MAVEGRHQLREAGPDVGGRLVEVVEAALDHDQAGAGGYGGASAGGEGDVAAVAGVAAEAGAGEAGDVDPSGQPGCPGVGGVVEAEAGRPGVADDVHRVAGPGDRVLAGDGVGGEPVAAGARVTAGALGE